MSDIYPVKTALLSVYYKEGVVPMAAMLKEAGVALLSSGGTAKTIEAAGISVKDVGEYTKSPPLFGHRVVTLHPKVHGGILVRRDDVRDQRDAEEYEIIPIDLVVVNLYPVEEAIGKPDATIDEVVEKTDIGGPALIRAAAKNHKWVTVVVDPADYMPIAEKIKANGGLMFEERLALAHKAFETTAAYDAKIAGFYAAQVRGINDGK